MTLDERARTTADVPEAEMERLLALALGRGGDFADLYFEHHTSSSILLEEGIIRTASMSIGCGLGVRVVVGEKTGCAYTDDLSSLPSTPIRWTSIIHTLTLWKGAQAGRGW